MRYLGIKVDKALETAEQREVAKSRAPVCSGTLLNRWFADLTLTTRGI